MSIKSFFKKAYTFFDKLSYYTAVGGAMITLGALIWPVGVVLIIPGVFFIAMDCKWAYEESTGVCIREAQLKNNPKVELGLPTAKQRRYNSLVDYLRDEPMDAKQQRHKHPTQTKPAAAYSKFSLATTWIKNSIWPPHLPPKGTAYNFEMNDIHIAGERERKRSYSS